MFIDEEDNYVIPTPKNEIIEIEDVVPPESPKLIHVIPQETVKLPKLIPKTDPPENIDIISVISDIMSMETTTLLNNKHLTMR